MVQNYISRAMEGVIREAAQYFSVISVTGPRTALLSRQFMVSQFTLRHSKGTKVGAAEESHTLPFGAESAQKKSSPNSITLITTASNPWRCRSQLQMGFSLP